MEVACTWSSALQVYDSVRTAALARGAQVLCHFSHAYLDGVSLYFTFAMRASAGDEGYFNLWSDVLEHRFAPVGTSRTITAPVSSRPLLNAQ